MSIFSSGSGGDLPQFIRDQLASPPKRGEGLHNWIFRIARQLHAHRSEEEIMHLLEAVTIDSGVRSGEIAEAVRNSKAVAWMPGRAPRFIPGKKWPDVNAELVAEIARRGQGLANLRDESPIQMDENGPDTEAIIDVLFPGNPLLCCGPSLREVETKPREDWRSQRADLQFIVPSPMLRRVGVTKEGKESQRCLDNTGPRRFLVVEFDSGTEDDQAGRLLHLAERAPMALVVSSGNRSLHGWFFCAGCDEEAMRSFFAYACKLGADPATNTPCQLVRMPGGLRDNGNRQVVHFFNPAVIQ